MSINLSALQKQRRDTAANWTAENPTLLAGEIGLESDTGYWKVGDGATAWTSLAYVSGLGAEIPVDRLADGAARQLLQTAANGTDVEWTDNVDVPGTLDVTGTGTFDGNVTIAGDLTVNGTTTTINTQDLLVEDKNVIIGNVTSPTDVTADGGGITLKGTTDKTINWVDSTDAWTLSEHVNIASGKEYRIDGTKVLDATSLGSGVLITSANITDGTIVDGDVNASAAIAGTKISPDFGSQNVTTTGTVTGASLNPTSSTVPTNGVYLPSANTVGISTNSVGRLFIDSSGNVGVGTSTPSQSWTGGSARAQQLSGLSNQITVFRINEAGGTYGDLQLVSAASSETAIYNFANGAMRFGTNGTERLRITSDGKVGVGTTSVSSNLHIKPANGDDSAFTNGLRVERHDTSGQYALFSYTGGAATITAVETTASNPVVRFLRSTNGSTTTESLRIDASGRLLVGTSSVRTTGWTTQVAGEIFQELTNYGGITCFTNANNEEGTFFTFGKSRGTAVGSNTVVQNNDRLGGINFQGTDGSASRTAAHIHAFVDGTPGANDMPGRLVFSTTADGASSPTERMRITNGAVKASTNGNYYSANSPYHEHYQSNNNWYNTVFNTSTTPNPYGIAINFSGASPDNNTEEFLVCSDSTATRMRVYSDGDVWTSDAGTLTSDVTLKRDITDTSPKLADVMNLRVRNFYWQEDYHPNKQDKKLIGFIAQEFEEVFPGLVSEHKINGGDPIFDEDGNDTGEKTPEVFKKGIKEAKLIPILVKALQEAVERIEQLEAKVAALETP